MQVNRFAVKYTLHPMVGLVLIAIADEMLSDLYLERVWVNVFRRLVRNNTGALRLPFSCQSEFTSGR